MMFFSSGIGGKPLTLAKAKRDNIRHQRLPLERYLKLANISFSP